MNTKLHAVTDSIGCLKDWRCIATCYDRSPMVFFSAIAFAATLLFWL